MPFASSMSRLALLCAALIWGGCVECEFSFPDVPLQVSGVLSASGDLTGDTLTVAVVDGLGGDAPSLFAAQDTLLPETSTDRRIELAYAVDGFVFDQTAETRLAAVAEGDTVFVYVQGTFDLVQEACSPSEGPFAEVIMQSVRAPVSVRTVWVTSVSAYELAPRTVDALRRADADRPRPVLSV